MNQAIISLLSLCPVFQLYAGNLELINIPKHDVIKSISKNNIDCHLALEKFNKTTDKKNSLIGYIIGDLLVKEEGILNISDIAFDDFFDSHTVDGRNVVVLKDHKVVDLLKMNFDQDSHCAQLASHAIRNRKNFDLQYDSVCNEYCSLNSDALKNFFHNQYDSTQSVNNNSSFQYNENSRTFNFQYVQTSGAGALCSFASILNYVKDMNDNRIEFKSDFAKEVNQLAEKHQYQTDGEAQEELRSLISNKIETFNFGENQTKASEIVFKYLTSILTDDIRDNIIEDLENRTINDNQEFLISILRNIKAGDYEAFDKELLKLNTFICSECLPYITYNDPYMIQLVALMMNVPCNVFQIDRNIEYANSKNMFNLRKIRSDQFSDDEKALNVLLDDHHFTYLKAVDFLCLEAKVHTEQLQGGAGVEVINENQRMNNRNLQAAIQASSEEEKDRAKRLKKEENDLEEAKRKSLEESSYMQGGVKNNTVIKVNACSTFKLENGASTFTHANTPDIGNLCSFAILSDYMRDMNNQKAVFENEFAKKVMNLAKSHKFNTRTETNKEKDGKLQKALRSLIADEIKDASLGTKGIILANEYIKDLLDDADRPSKGMYAKLHKVIEKLESNIKVLEERFKKHSEEEKELPIGKRTQSIETLEKLQSDRKILEKIQKIATDGYEDSNNIDVNYFQLISVLLPYTTMNNSHIIRIVALMMDVECNVFMSDKSSRGEGNEFDMKLSDYDHEFNEIMHTDPNTLNILLYNELDYKETPNHYTYLKPIK